MTWLLEQACQEVFAFVIWFLPTDIDVEAWNHPPELEFVAAIFANNGLYDLSGDPRPAQGVWSDVLRSGCPAIEPGESGSG